LSLKRYVNCDPLGDVSTAIRLVNQEITDLISDINLSFDSDQVSFNETQMAVDDLLLAIDDLLQSADTPELRGLSKAVDTLCLLPVDAGKEEEEKRLSLSELAVINGTAVMQDSSGYNVDEIRKLVKILGIDKVEKLLSSSKAGEKIVIITKPYQIEVYPVNQKLPTIDYINSTYNININESDVAYIYDGNVLSDKLNTPQSTNMKAVVNLEQFIGQNISLDSASKIANVPIENLNIYTFIIGGSITNSSGKALFKTIGYNSSGFNSSSFNLRIKINNIDEYQIDITSDNGSSSNYDPATVAATLSFQIPDISVQAIGGELVFMTNKVGATASIEFIESDENDASIPCGIITSLKKIYDESTYIDNSNVKISDIPVTSYVSDFTGVSATKNTENPTSLSNLPKIIIKGGNSKGLVRVTKNDITRFKSIGFSNEQISVISTGASLAEMKPDKVTDSISSVENIFSLIYKMLSKTGLNKEQIIDTYIDVLRSCNDSIAKFNVAKSANNFQVITISDPNLFNYLRNYENFSDYEIEILFNSRDDIHSINTFSTDEDIIHKINELSSSLPGSTGLSEKCLNKIPDSIQENNKLFNNLDSQLSSFASTISISELRQLNDVAILQKKMHDSSSFANSILSSLGDFNSTFVSNINPEETSIDGFTTYDSPSSLMMRTINPYKTFKISKESDELQKAVVTLSGLSSGTDLLVGSVSKIVDSAILQYSALNEKVQAQIRGWSNSTEIGAGILSNLTGNGYAAQALLKCAFSTQNISLNNDKMNVCLEKLDNLIDKMNTSVSKVTTEFTKITDQLLCKINTLLSKIDVSSNQELPFHCSAQLKVGFNPSITYLINKISVKLYTMIKLLKICSSNYRLILSNLKNQRSPLESFINSNSFCESDTINRYFGANGEITNLATDALSKFEIKFTLPSTITSKFSLSQPPKNLEDSLKKVNISLPKVPKI
jgi:hypothetical protein